MKRIAFLMTAVLALGACGDIGTDPDETAFVGIYSLVSLDGKTLPYLSYFTSGDTLKYDLTAGVLALAEDGTALEGQSYQITFKGQASPALASRPGVWEQAGTGISLLFPYDDSEFRGSVAANRLTLVGAEGTLIYEK